jgi:monothiol glutaredoxin
MLSLSGGLDPPKRHAKDHAMSQQAVHDHIAKLITANDVVLFMKGTKGMAQCGFSHQVDAILQHLGVDYKPVNVLESMEIREGIKSFSNWPTIPQLYIKGEFVGGCDIVREMFQAGELQDMLSDKGVAHNERSLSA